MIFQTIDDKSECIGVYSDGKLYYDDFPENLSKTWKYGGSITDPTIKYAWLFCEGLDLNNACPTELESELLRIQKRLRAYIKSFKIAKVNMGDHCIFDLVPEDFLKQFCEIKNKITEHVFENFEEPQNYAHLDAVQKLLFKIKYQKLNLNNEGCKELYYSSINRARANLLLEGPRFIDYNLFGTITGRLTTRSESFPALTLKRDFRKLLKPHNDWFLSLDYNAAEVRTFIALTGEEQPLEDVHQWHIKNLIEDELTREDAKIRFFAWLYNYDSNDDEFAIYHRQALLSEWYSGTHVTTPFKRKIRVDSKKALNYLIQSTTADIVLERAVEIDKFLEDKKSFISHIVHDEIIIDLADEERELIPEIKKLFSENQLANYLVNLNVGKNYYDLEELKL